MLKTYLFLILAVAFTVFTACGTGGNQQTTSDANTTRTAATAAEVKTVSVAETSRAVETDGSAQFIDVRTPEEYAAGHAPKAANMPLDNLEKDLARLDKDRPVYVICESGGRSKKGAGILHKAGFKEIYNVGEGTAGWRAAGLPIEK